MDRRGDPCRGVGLSHLRDLRPRDSAAGWAPVACVSRDLGSRFLAEGDRRCAADEIRSPASRPTGTADRMLTARPGTCRSRERWIPGRLEAPRPERAERLTRRAGARGDSTTGARSVAIDGRCCGAIHRLRDTGQEWPIQVRVTTANAGCVNTRDLSPNRGRPRVKAVPARAPAGSSASLPAGDRLR